MKRLALLLACSLVAAPVFAAGKTYQATGPVLEVRDDAIVIEKGKEKWEIARTPGTAVKGELKKGAKVTVEYTMSATKIDVKEDKKK
jgi:cytochrome c1